MRIWGKAKNYSLEFVNFTVGVVVLMFELVAARIVTPYIGNTVYTWTSIIGVILAALAVGYWFGGRLADRRMQPEDVVRLLVLAAASILIMTVLKDGILTTISGNSMPLQLQALIAGLILFAIPTALLGAASPYLARLSIRDLKTSGQRLARMSAAGTVGSLIGTFLTGYVLFGYLGTHLILCLIIIILIAVSFVMSRRLLLVQRLLIALASILLTQTSLPVNATGLIRDTDTAYSRVLIRNLQISGEPARILQIDNQGLESGEFLDGSKRLAFGYNRAFAYLAGLNPKAKDTLIIGGGAFSLPSYFSRTQPGARIDVVELDGKLQTLSSKYFGFKKPGGMNIYTQDGRAYLNRNKNLYDAIYNDAFTSVIPPFQLLTKEAVLRLKASLKPQGFTAVNIISPLGGEPFKSVADTFGSVFPHVLAFPINPRLDRAANQNIVLIASSREILPEQLDALARSAEEHDFAFNAFVPEVSSRLVMTDNYAPIERLAGKNL